MSSSDRAVYARVRNGVQNPLVVPFALPFGVRRLTVSASGAARGAQRAELEPVAIVPPDRREPTTPRTIEAIPEHPGAYLGYTNEHAYPEGGVFWTRGTGEAAVLVAPAGARRMTVTLFSGPSGADCYGDSFRRSADCEDHPWRSLDRLICRSRGRVIHASDGRGVHILPSLGIRPGIDRHPRAWLPGQGRTRVAPVDAGAAAGSAFLDLLADSGFRLLQRALRASADALVSGADSSRVARQQPRPGDIPDARRQRFSARDGDLFAAKRIPVRRRHDRGRMLGGGLGRQGLLQLQCQPSRRRRISRRRGRWPSATASPLALVRSVLAAVRRQPGGRRLRC